MSSSPVLLSTCLRLLHLMTTSRSILLNPDRNPILSKILKATFYAQFCAGETKQEVAVSTRTAREQFGYDGIILDYALEVLEVEGGREVREEAVRREVEHWLKGMLETVDVAREGDFMGVKLSGLGHHALQLLKSNQTPTPLLSSALSQLCLAATSKNIALLIDAEEETTNPGIESWALALQRTYNTSGRAMIYTTYQCYLQSAPQKLARDLEIAGKEGFVLGIKLVRGAYLEAERRRGVKVWASKEETDKCYDGIAEALLKRQWNSTLRPLSPESSNAPFPTADLLLATHNHPSIQRVLSLRTSQLHSTSNSPSPTLPRLAYGQLQGMADEISQELVAAGQGKRGEERPRVFKCMTWGSTTECLNFLLRRAAENKEIGRAHV